MATYRRDFLGRPEQVQAARQFITELVPSWSPAQAIAELLVTEAATNALLHSASGAPGGSFAVICTVGDGLLHVEVADDGSAGSPTIRVHGLESVTGRGLELFAALANRWGIDGDVGGHTVWFELTVDKEVIDDGAYDWAVRPGAAHPQPGPLRGDTPGGAASRLAA
jgi:anti-sigma regulatory factor (Ser/Thr protein kinase)